ncbi:chorismate mutase [Streptomyces sp. NPDC058385]|uniref:chorismate mutase n=1 Tax=Streptomyces sp. NPDC058385 TaxID=3346473 RepID=UPI00364FE273
MTATTTAKSTTAMTTTAADAAAKDTAEKTGARTSEAADVITGARDRIDALDDRIIGLIQERMAVSAVIQEARITSGGRRVNLARELEVLGHYRDALGKPGTALAMTLLELCRGRV